MIWRFLWIYIFFQAVVFASDFKTVQFNAHDGVRIRGDLYSVDANKSRPFIVLFHQARSSRGEYREIAPKLNALGFNVLAIDQRSGDGINGVENETVMDALEKDKKIGYLDAMVDLKSTLTYVREHFANEKLIGWGSSYSASLILKLAGDMPDKLDGVIAFSPGEYFKPKVRISDSAKNIKVPVFITSMRKEKKRTSVIFGAVGSKKVYFLPKGEGEHGSKALWQKSSEHKEYWHALEKFLKQF
jgi:alpha-beta hydrolase superfamily lysophospholipase